MDAVFHQNLLGVYVYVKCVLNRHGFDAVYIFNVNLENIKLLNLKPAIFW